MKESKLYLFDMDGVLFNTKLNMKKSWNNVRKKFKLHIKFENYFEHIGIPFEKILENLKIYKDIKKIKSYYQDQSIRHQNLVKIYPGVSVTINKLLEKDESKKFSEKEFLLHKANQLLLQLHEL